VPMIPLRLFVRVAIACVVCSCVAPAKAGIVIASTRVVYPAEAADVTVRLTNQRATPALVEAWIESDDGNAPAPFAMTPPLFRIEAGRGQALRLRRLPDAAFPTDRESLYWLNVLDVPPDAPEVGGGNVLKMAVRTRLKVFVRPPGLAGRADRAALRLAWSRVGDALRIDNPTPFHVTIAHVRITGGEPVRGTMVAPFGHATLALDAVHMPAWRIGARVEFGAINDAGGIDVRTAPLTVAP
jgi:P pilus assembly chaperone PapD